MAGEQATGGRPRGRVLLLVGGIAAGLLVGMMALWRIRAADTGSVDVEERLADPPSTED